MIAEPENAIVFDQDAVANWVQLCDTNGELHANGASPEEIAISNLNVILGMVNLVAPVMNYDETMGLLTLLLLQNGNITNNIGDLQNTEAEDPASHVENPIVVDSDSDNEQNN